MPNFTFYIRGKLSIIRNNYFSTFRIELADVARKWDQDERIGDAFVASFSKSIGYVRLGLNINIW